MYRNEIFAVYMNILYVHTCKYKLEFLFKLDQKLEFISNIKAVNILHHVTILINRCLLQEVFHAHITRNLNVYVA